MRKNSLCESEIMRKLINEMSVPNNIVLSQPDELMEFLWVKPKISGINVDIFVDDSKSYQRNNRPLLLFARNGYDKSVGEFIPFSISEHPSVLNDEMEFNISYDDIFLIQDFIQVNRQLICNLADYTISQREFFDNVVKVVPPEFCIVAESRTVICEMSTLRTKVSGLPVDIWLDEGGTYQGNAPRIKFRASNEQKSTREFSSMLLTTPPPTIEKMPNNSPLRSKDIKKLKAFVVNNLDLLLELANGEIDYDPGFLSKVIF